MKILVTGGAGFIGSHLVEALLERGDNVVVVDNFNSFYDPKLKEKNVQKFLKNVNFKLYKVDIRDKNVLTKIFYEEKPEKIMHLAAMAGVRPSLKNPELYFDVNVNGSLNLLNLAVKFEIKNFVYASSSSIYGNNKKIPFAESDKVDNPISPYAASKKSLELLASVYSHLYGLNCTGLRFFTVYGPNSRPDMAHRKFANLIINKKKIKVYGDGTTKRDYTYVKDIVSGVVSALDKKFRNEIFNLGNENPVSLNEFVDLFEKNLGKVEREYVPEQMGDVSITYADISKAKEKLGYEPKISFSKGMELYCKWFQN
tara:strand:+ start:2502 stop:3440 length:939 start_codon:yes stop_codon:yes gene_type:complete